MWLSVEPRAAGVAAAHACGAPLRRVAGQARVVVPPQLRHSRDILLSEEGDAIEKRGARTRQQHGLRGDVCLAAVIEEAGHVALVLAVDDQMLHIMRNFPWQFIDRPARCR